MDAHHAATSIADVAAPLGLAVAGIAALAMAVFRVRRSEAMPPALAILSGAGLIALAIDEAADAHARAGRWLVTEYGTSPGPVNEVADLIVLGYLALAGFVFVAALPVIARSPRFLIGLVAGGALLATGAGLDAFSTIGPWEEVAIPLLESGGALMLALVFALEARRNEPRPLVGMRLEQPRMRSHASIPR